MKDYRHLTASEIDTLKQNGCTHCDWSLVWVKENFKPDYIRDTVFSGEIKLGVLEKDFLLDGGVKKHACINRAVIHHCEIGDNVVIENIQNYIANYRIGDNCFIQNVDVLLVEGKTTFGNGVKVNVLNEMGGREVHITDKLSAHFAYIYSLYRHRPKLIEQMKAIIDFYSEKHASDIGTIGNDCVIVNVGYIKNVSIGSYCKITGTMKLKNGSINSNKEAPVHIGRNVIARDFIISSGSRVDGGTIIERCFVGQACHLDHGYSASDSLFFSNCRGENGEACAVFAGPYTVTHHKSTLLIAGMFSFMNAGSGSNQSNHMYKLGPIHQGIVERGAKTTGRSFRIAKHNADFLTQLINKYTRSVCFTDSCRKFSQSLRHQSRLQSHFRVSHFPFEFSSWCKGCNRIDNYDIYCRRANELFGDLQCLFAAIGLRDKQILNINAQLLGIKTIKSMFCINKCSYSSRFLCLGNGMNSQCGFP
jgi:NDP-sugar pyrophosphorylase family protein